MALQQINGNQISTSTAALITQLSFLNTSSVFQLPTGPSGDRPSSPPFGVMRFNTTIDSVEVYKADSDGQGNPGWGSVGGGGPSRGRDSIVRTNRNYINETISIGPTSGEQFSNGTTIGPIEIRSGAVITVETGGYWYILGQGSDQLAAGGMVT